MSCFFKFSFKFFLEHAWKAAGSPMWATAPLLKAGDLLLKKLSISNHWIVIHEEDLECNVFAIATICA